jgi:hypothetical protein
VKKNHDLLAKIASIELRAKERAANETPALALQLPLWPDPVRAVPNGVLRSALFGAIQKGARRYMQRELVASLDGVEIRYTGQRLDQGDLDTWESVLHAARLYAMGEHCRVTSYGLLKLMGKTDTGKNRMTLHTRISRLRACAVEIKQGRFLYVGGLVDEAFKDEKTQVWVIALNPKLHALFATDQFTLIDWEVRQSLNGKPLAQWLHGFYASHARPYPIKVATLQKLCGSEAELRRYRQTLRAALTEVELASAAVGVKFKSEIRAGLVYVEKKASAAQERYLIKKIAKPHRHT